MKTWTRLLALGAIGLAALAVAPLSAQDRDGREKHLDRCDACERREQLEHFRAALIRLPVNPFADAKPGDWWAYLVKETAQGKPLAKRVATLTVSEQDGDDVQLSETQSPESPTAKPVFGHGRWFDRQDSPTIGGFLFGGSPGRKELRFADVKQDDETRSVAGETFRCKKVSWLMIEDAAGGAISRAGSVTVWLAPDARGAVAAITFRVVGDDDTKVKYELGGYGSSGGKVDWGRSPEQLLSGK